MTTVTQQHAETIRVLSAAVPQAMVTTGCLCVAQSCYYMQRASIWGRSLGPGRDPPTAIFRDLHERCPSPPGPARPGLAVSCDWHATRGISSGVIVRESHTGTLKDKQSPTGCKHWHFYGGITREGKKEIGGRQRKNEARHQSGRGADMILTQCRQ